MVSDQEYPKGTYPRNMFLLIFYLFMDYIRDGSESLVAPRWVARDFIATTLSISWVVTLHGGVLWGVKNLDNTTLEKLS